MLSDQLAEVCISREIVSYIEDTLAKLTINDLVERKKNIYFIASHTPDLINSNNTSAYWLRFYINNESDKAFRIEIFDFDIDEVSFFISDSLGNYQENKAGYAYPFDQIRPDYRIWPDRIHAFWNFLLPDALNGFL